ncbi:MAG: orotate phosphoribosyltransferase [Candidatus Aenigmarchaeota archaeon]|nr:orotate phosphoribosyltransferase [Candidatus Aenigmarchaeota archaeon]
MKHSGICPICGDVMKIPQTCVLCGSTVCQNDFDPERGLCKRCETGKIQ